MAGELAGLPRFASLEEYGNVRDALLDRIVAALEADPRVGAAWLSGSFGRGEADEWADLDLHVAVEDEHLVGFWDERETLYRRVGRPVLVQGEMESDAMPAARFQLVMFDGSVEVDWNIGPLSRAVRPLAYRMLIERAPVPVVALPPLTEELWREQAERWLVFFWAMAPIAAKLAGRAETRRAVHQIGLLSTAYIALWRLLRGPEVPEPLLHWTNRILEPELDAALPQLGPAIDQTAALATIRALCAAVERFHPALAEHSVPVPVAMPAQVAAVCDLAESVLRRGVPAKRKYR